MEFAEFVLLLVWIFGAALIAVAIIKVLMAVWSTLVILFLGMVAAACQKIEDLFKKF